MKKKGAGRGAFLFRGSLREAYFLKLSSTATATATVARAPLEIAFGAGSAISLSGLSAFTPERLRSLKIVIATAEEYEGLGNVKVMGDVVFTKDTEPHVAVRANGKLVVRFGRRGLMLFVH